MKSIFTFLIIFILGFNTFSQDCTNNLQFKKDASITTSSYNDKGKLMGFSKSTCLAVSVNGETTTAQIKNESFNASGKSESSHEFTMSCQKDVIIMDIKLAMNSQTNNQNNMAMRIEGDGLEFPSSLSVGQMLKDAKAKIIMSSPEMPMEMSMDFFITNRKVEALESIQVSSTTYECYKISYETESVTNMMGMKNSIKGKIVQWYHKDLGPVKTMNYDKDGKLLGSAIITEIKK
jgi:hypothetical protein